MARARFPDALVLLTGCVLVAAGLTFVLPAGQYDREIHAETGRSLVVGGSYHAVEANPMGPFDAMVAIPRGMVDAAEIVILIFLLGGAFFVVDETGAIRTGIDSMLRALRGRDVLIVPLAAAVFGMAGALNNMLEEFIALMPALVLLARRVGYKPLVAVAMSAGAAMVGAAFSPINPFQVGIAQGLAEVPLLSGWAFRTVFGIVALGLWIAMVSRYALTHRSTDPVVVEPPTRDDTRLHGPILVTVGVTFAVMVWGLTTRDWGFNEMSGLFFGMGIVAGLMGGMGLQGTAASYTRGFRAMAYAALLVGLARAIFVVLDDGRIVDTIVQGLFTPVEGLPLALSGLAMMASHVVIHIPVPSVTGHAVLTMPVLVPLADLLGMSRQVVVLTYQYGGGLCDLLTPTHGSLLAILAASGVAFDDWFRFAFPRIVVLMALGAIAIVTAIGLGLQ